jgi:transcriptional regulator with XRE-family HTH domain
MEEAGQKLKRVRERLNLRYRDVEEASNQIAARHNNDEFSIALSRLSDIENKGTVPTIYRLYSLCTIYRLDVNEVMDWYGVNIATLASDAAAIHMERTHLIGFRVHGYGETQIPLSLDPGIDLRRTTFLSRVIQRWGRLPLALLNSLDVKSYTMPLSVRKTGPCIRSFSLAR